MSFDASDLRKGKRVLAVFELGRKVSICQILVIFCLIVVTEAARRTVWRLVIVMASAVIVRIAAVAVSTSVVVRILVI